eukprot:1788932-Pyramimonas_sp.AAC.1
MDCVQPGNTPTLAGISSETTPPTSEIRGASCINIPRSRRCTGYCVLEANPARRRGSTVSKL